MIKNRRIENQPLYFPCWPYQSHLNKDQGHSSVNRCEQIWRWKGDWSCLGGFKTRASIHSLGPGTWIKFSCCVAQCVLVDADLWRKIVLLHRRQQVPGSPSSYDKRIQSVFWKSQHDQNISKLRTNRIASPPEVEIHGFECNHFMAHSSGPHGEVANIGTSVNHKRLGHAGV